MERWSGGALEVEQETGSAGAAQAEGSSLAEAGWVAEGVQNLARESGIFRLSRGRERPVAVTALAATIESPPAAPAPDARVATAAKPRALRIQGKVRVASGPWELEERWWAEDRTERDYWDVELEDGALYRIYRERRSERWFADGVYD